ncbi:MAG: hypothetical protein FWE67_04110 [Planctomycetaceae bacterium]|nr:hypothetical protein [Planctomycetaceae bacterium]
MTEVKVGIDWSTFKPIPGFDCLKWKDERQAQILKETENMSTQEVLDYFRKGSEAFQREIAEIRRKKQEGGD